MTTLRDDGDMETDDAVVQACFLGRHVRRLRGGKWINDILGRIEINHSVILIPAKTVYDNVTFADPPDYPTMTEEVIVFAVRRAGVTLYGWLRKHADPGA